MCRKIANESEADYESSWISTTVDILKQVNKSSPKVDHLFLKHWFSKQATNPADNSIPKIWDQLGGKALAKNLAINKKNTFRP